MPLWTTDLAIVVALLVASELAFRGGRIMRSKFDEPMRAQITTAQASTLGLLALMLGFTLSMAESRFNGRRVLLVQEAAAIGTTYLRAAYLPEPYRAPSRQLLRDYVKSRRAFFDATIAEAPAATAHSTAIQDQLWKQVVEMAPRYLDSDVMALYIDSLNEMIDLEMARDVAVRARVPWTINLLLILIALVAVGITGYATGLGGGRLKTSVWLIPIMIALSCAIIADLDRARAGYITTGDLPLRRLEQAMAEEQAAQRP